VETGNGKPGEHLMERGDQLVPGKCEERQEGDGVVQSPPRGKQEEEDGDELGQALYVPADKLAEAKAACQHNYDITERCLEALLDAIPRELIPQLDETDGSDAIEDQKVYAANHMKLVEALVDHRTETLKVERNTLLVACERYLRQYDSVHHGADKGETPATIRAAVAKARESD
jgi:hypothetical protein